MDKDWSVWHQYLFEMCKRYYTRQTMRSVSSVAGVVHGRSYSGSLVNKPDSGSAPKSSGSITDLKISDFSAGKLNESDLQEIVTRLGSKIENIYDLTPGQKWMLGEGRQVNSEFFLQFLFKAVIPLKPYTLRQKVEQVVEKRDNLRSAYISKGLSQPYRVVLKNRQAELKFEDLSDLSEQEFDGKMRSVMDADRRRGFDLERDTLLRISVYKACVKDTYAILLSQPHINTDGMSTMLLLKDIFVDYALETSGIEKMLVKQLPKVSYEEYARWLESRDRQGELDYWKKLLADMPGGIRAPGSLNKMQGKTVISQSSLVFCEQTQKGLTEKQAAFHVTPNSIMQAAWSIMLMKMYHTDDVMFGAITSGREAGVKMSSMIMGGFVNAIPVRAYTDGDQNVGEFARNLQKQFMDSLMHAHCSPDEIRDAIGERNKLFDHLLNFHNFEHMLPSQGFMGAGSVSGLSFIDSQMYDNLSTDLTVYFKKGKKGISCNFVYNFAVFTDARIHLLMSVFEQVVDQIAHGPESMKISDISCPDLTVFDTAARDEQELQNDIASFLGGIDLFDNVPKEEIQLLAVHARLTEYMPDDIILMERTDVHDLMLVYDGNVEIFRKSGDGWICPLLLLNRGRMIAASGIWDEEHSYFGARAYREGTRVLSIPGDVMRLAIAREPSIGKNVMKELYKRAGTFSLLWINQ